MKHRFLLLVLAVCLILCAAAPAVMAAEQGEIARREIAGAEYFCIRDLEAVSDISVSVQDQTATLREDGLEVSLSADSNYVLRGSDLVAAMAQRPVVEDGNFYASVDFLEAFLCADGAAQPSLFHGMKFRAGEVLTALYAKDKSAFDQKLLWLPREISALCAAWQAISCPEKPCPIPRKKPSAFLKKQPMPISLLPSIIFLFSTATERAQKRMWKRQISGG